MTNRHAQLVPGDVVGILGGGQLGRMLAVAASQLGLRTHVYSNVEPCPAAQVANALTVASFDDEAALRSFADAIDVVTYEFENVPVTAVELLTENGVIARPNGAALATAQDRLIEKQFLESIDAKTAPYFPVEDLQSLKEGLEKVGRPAILKTRRLGYDGRGQSRIDQSEDKLSDAYDKAVAHAWREVGAAPSILEGFIPFKCEISVIGARGADGAVKLYEPAENRHAGGILRRSMVPSNVSEATKIKAGEITTALLSELNYVGVLGLEFFVLADGSLIANEFAPRVHNSGHWTLGACNISQFEQQIRCVAGWPLGETVRHSDAVMSNLIGDEIHRWRDLASDGDVIINHYGKKDARPGRKMGHYVKLSRRPD